MISKIQSSFQFSCPAKTAFGVHALYHLPFDLAGMDACKAFVITDAQACEAKLDILLSEAFKDSDTALGFATLTDDDCSDPALLENLYNLFRDKGYDSIIALGTDRLLQTAKELNMLASFGPKFLRTFKEIENIETPLRPFVFIPTLPTNGRECMMETIFQGKRFVSPFLMPDIVVISPDAMLTPPDDIILDSALSNFALCCEAFVFSDNPVARPYADLAINLIINNLLPLLREHEQGADKNQGANKNQRTDKNRAKAYKKRQVLLSGLVNAAVISGYIRSNIKDMKTASKLSNGYNMIKELLSILKDSDSPWLTELLLPLSNQDKYCTSSVSDRPKLALNAIQDFINELSEFFPVEVLQTVNITKPEGGENTDSISPADKALKSFIRKSIPDYYEFCCKTTIAGGHDALEKIPDYLIALGAENPMIITDKGVNQAGLTDILINALAGRVTVKSVQDEVPPDSDIETVHNIARKYREEKCDSIIALGGGSVLDTAKGVNILVSEAGDNLLAFTGAGALKHRLKPLIAVPTTAGTGSEVTLVAVISDPAHKRKLLFTSYFLLPDVAIIDSRMTLTLPAHITAATAMDALSHAVESCICLAANPVSRIYAYEAIDLIRRNLLTVVKNPQNKEGRLALATAATLAGMAFSNSMVGMVHTIGHSVGSVCHIAHGTCMAILLPYGMEYNYHKIEDELADLLLPLAGEEVLKNTPPFARAQKAIDQVRRLNMDLQAATAGAHPVCFSDIKDKNGQALVPGHKLAKIAKTALGDGSIFYNPEELSYEDCLQVLNAAFEGKSLRES